jgi:hypothetical protein
MLIHMQVGTSVRLLRHIDNDFPCDSVVTISNVTDANATVQKFLFIDSDDPSYCKSRVSQIL